MATGCPCCVTAERHPVDYLWRVPHNPEVHPQSSTGKSPAAMVVLMAVERLWGFLEFSTDSPHAPVVGAHAYGYAKMSLGAAPPISPGHWGQSPSSPGPPGTVPTHRGQSPSSPAHQGASSRRSRVNGYLPTNGHTHTSALGRVAHGYAPAINSDGTSRWGTLATDRPCSRRV